MNKILIILGTRPQYIKIKPLYDYLKKNNANFFMIDTNQHFSFNVSDVFIDEFNIDINYNLGIKNTSSIGFLSQSIIEIEKVVDKEKPSVVLVIGDTNSTLSGALVANKKDIVLGHIEAGIRCGDKNRPEEVNRILVDELSNIHFISRKQDKINVSNPFLVGDLEYNLLNSLNIQDSIYEEWILMTIHRKENTTEKRIREIFETCEKNEGVFVFPIHHRTKKLIEKNNIKLPSNIIEIESQSYKNILSLLSRCKGLFTDSGGLVKIAPFFGKKCLVPLDVIEWVDVVDKGYCSCGLDFSWFDECEIQCNKDLYYNPKACSIIYERIKDYV